MANLILGFIMDVIIFWGTAMGTAMSATAAANQGVISMPPLAVALFALTVAVVQAGRRWDSKRAPSPVKSDPVPVAQIDAVVKREVAAQMPKAAPPTPQEVLAQQAAEVRQRPAVTPNRVEGG